MTHRGLHSEQSFGSANLRPRREAGIAKSYVALGIAGLFLKGGMG